jgi:hypothetical protein
MGDAEPERVTVKIIEEEKKEDDLNIEEGEIEEDAEEEMKNDPTEHDRKMNIGEGNNEEEEEEERDDDDDAEDDAENNEVASDEDDNDKSAKKDERVRQLVASGVPLDVAEIMVNAGIAQTEEPTPAPKPVMHIYLDKQGGNDDDKSDKEDDAEVSDFHFSDSE